MKYEYRKAHVDVFLDRCYKVTKECYKVTNVPWPKNIVVCKLDEGWVLVKKDSGYILPKGNLEFAENTREKAVKVVLNFYEDQKSKGKSRSFFDDIFLFQKEVSKDCLLNPDKKTQKELKELMKFYAKQKEKKES